MTKVNALESEPVLSLYAYNISVLFSVI